MAQTNYLIFENDPLNVGKSDPEFEIHEWIPEGILRSEATAVSFKTTNGKTASKIIAADSFYGIFRLHADKPPFPSRLLLEVDNATHSNKRFANEKVLPGIAYIRSNAYQTNFRYSVDKGKTIGGRWMIVTVGQKRLEFLRNKTVRAGGENADLFYFTTYDEAMAAKSRLKSEIWLVAGKGDNPVALFPPM